MEIPEGYELIENYKLSQDPGEWEVLMGQGKSGWLAMDTAELYGPRYSMSSRSPSGLMLVARRKSAVRQIEQWSKAHGTSSFYYEAMGMARNLCRGMSLGLDLNRRYVRGQAELIMSMAGVIQRGGNVEEVTHWLVAISDEVFPK